MTRTPWAMSIFFASDGVLFSTESHFGTFEYSIISLINTFILSHSFSIFFICSNPFASSSSDSSSEFLLLVIFFVFASTFSV